MNPKIYRMLYIALGVLYIASVLTAYNFGQYRAEAKPAPTLVSIQGEKFSVIQDETGCYYMTYNGYGVSPLFDKNGKVKGCGSK
jgi:hypothetical protein